MSLKWAIHIDIWSGSSSTEAARFLAQNEQTELEGKTFHVFTLPEGHRGFSHALGERGLRAGLLRRMQSAISLRDATESFQSPFRSAKSSVHSINYMLYHYRRKLTCQHFVFLVDECCLLFLRPKPFCRPPAHLPPACPSHRHVHAVCRMQ